MGSPSSPAPCSTICGHSRGVKCPRPINRLLDACIQAFWFSSSGSAPALAPAEVAMKTIRNSAIRLLASVAVLVIGGATLGQTPILAVQAPVLKQRVVRAKPARTILNPKLRSDVIVVKFREGTRVRER